GRRQGGGQRDDGRARVPLGSGDRPAAPRPRPPRQQPHPGRVLAGRGAAGRGQPRPNPDRGEAGAGTGERGPGQGPSLGPGDGSGAGPLRWPCRRGRVRRLLPPPPAPGGRRRAAGGRDTTAVVWDVGAALAARKRPAEPSPRALAAAWADLAGDADRAYRAVGLLATAPAFLKGKLPPLADLDAKGRKRLD